MSKLMEILAIILSIFIFFIFIAPIALLLGGMFIDSFDPYANFTLREVIRFEKSLRWQRDSINQKIISGELPAVGVFKQDSPEGRIIWEASPPELIQKSPEYIYTTIISLDYQSGKLYTGFKSVYFLKSGFRKEGAIKKWLNEEVPAGGLYGSKYMLQNIKDEPYVSGDTILTLTAILSSDDIALIKTIN